MKCLVLLLAVLAPAAVPVMAAPLLVTISDPTGKPVEGAVVAVTVAGASRMAPAGAAAQVAQQGRQFVPQVSIVQAGTAVSFPNLDTVRHHVYSFSPVKTFELKLYAGTPSTPVVFERAGTAVLGCNIHDRMSAWVVVVETPYFGRTDAAGQLRLELPDGEHLLKAWRPMQVEPVAAVERRVRGGTPVQLSLAAAPGV